MWPLFCCPPPFPAPPPPPVQRFRLVLRVPPSLHPSRCRHVRAVRGGLGGHAGIGVRRGGGRAAGVVVVAAKRGYKLSYPDKWCWHQAPCATAGRAAAAHPPRVPPPPERLATHFLLPCAPTHSGPVKCPYLPPPERLSPDAPPNAPPHTAAPSSAAVPRCGTAPPTAPPSCWCWPPSHTGGCVCATVAVY